MYRLQNNYRHIYLSADFHAYHKNICVGSTTWSKGTMRDFDNELDMTIKLVDNINKVVKSDDLLIHLGDWSFGGKDKIKRFREQLKCEKIINILGNHDHHIRKHKDYSNLFEWIGDYLEIKYNKKKICLCHYPMVSWNCANSGGMMCHGHCHHSLLFRAGRIMDVGIDGPGYDFKPLSIEFVYDQLSSIIPCKIDHHFENST